MLPMATPCSKDTDVSAEQVDTLSEKVLHYHPGQAAEAELEPKARMPAIHLRLVPHVGG